MEFALQSEETPGVTAWREIYVKFPRTFYFLAALVTTGALTFILTMAKRERAAVPLLYSHPKGGDREGEFELFIGS